MRIIDEEGREIQPEDVDYDEGYLVPDKLFIRHHDEIPEQPEIYHYTVDTFYFKDGSSLKIIDEKDPHIKVIDDQIGKFEYVDQGEGRVCHGMDIKRIVDQEYQEYVPAWDEYEDILRYKLFTEEEKKKHEEEKEKARREQELLDTGLDRIENNEKNIGSLTQETDDLNVEMADQINVLAETQDIASDNSAAITELTLTLAELIAG